MRTIDDILSENLKRIRKSKGYRSQEAFAEAAGMPFPTYRDIEGGRWPEKGNLLKVAAALDVHPSRLFVDMASPPISALDALEIVDQALRGIGSKDAQRDIELPKDFDLETAVADAPRARKVKPMVQPSYPNRELRLKALEESEAKSPSGSSSLPAELSQILSEIDDNSRERLLDYAKTLPKRTKGVRGSAK